MIRTPGIGPLVAASLLAALAASAETPPSAPSTHAQAGPHGHWGPIEGQCPVAADGAARAGGWQEQMASLELTAEQRGAIQALSERYRTRAFDLSQRGRALRELMSGTEPDDPRYAEATREAGAVAGQIAADAVQLLADWRAEVHAILSAEQRQRLKDATDAESRRWAEWRERHRSEAPR